MDESGAWTPVPIAMTSAGASGPVDQAFFHRYVAMIEQRLGGEDRLRLDGQDGHQFREPARGQLAPVLADAFAQALAE